MPNNGLYEFYQEFFLDGFRDPQERDPYRENISIDAYQYEISNEEKEFYERFYTPQGKALDVKEHQMFIKLFGDIGRHIIFGEHMKDLLDFVDLPENLGLLIAPIGWGKTALIRYLWFYLIGLSNELQKRVIPIYIAIDHNKNQFSGQLSPNQISNIFFNDILRERLIGTTSPFTQVDDEQFWDYLKKGSDRFKSLAQYEEAIQKIHFNDPIAIKSNVLNERMKTFKMRDFHTVALKYIREKLGKIPFLILDNVDTLPLPVNLVILDEAIYLAKEFNLKILISMRTPTYLKIDEDHESGLRAHPPVKIEMEKPDVKNYLAHRTLPLRKKIRVASPRFKYINYIGDINVNFKDGAKVYDAMLEMLLGEESLKILSFIANYNLRKVNSLVLKYLATGYIDEYNLVKKVVGRATVDEGYSKSPLWILLSSVITNNYSTRFSEVGMSYQEGVLNLYCNGRKSPQEFLIRTHILDFVKRNREVNLQNIIDAYLSLDDNNQSQKIDNLKYAIWRLQEFDLLDSPDCYKLEKVDDIENVKSITITETGNFYRLELRNFYEYLIYMKDDIELANNPYEMQDCITITDFKLRYYEAWKLLRMIYESEHKFLFDLKKEQRIAFIANFSIPEDSMPFIVRAPIVSQISFGKAKNMPAEIIKMYQELLEEVEKDVEAFNNSIRE
jgi:hypothetical protein